MLCKICSNRAERRFEAVIRGKYAGSYFQCPTCQFLFINEPTWLDEAYEEAINTCDTGILQRNIRLREPVSVLLYHFYNRNGRFLDYAGGYGIFTRLMRDIGFDYYWSDKYSQNIFAKGFEASMNQPADLVTAFEVFEHLDEPCRDIDQMLKISRNLLFTTELLPDPLPKPHEWWYYGVEHGQHISFYTRQTLKWLARSYNLNYFSLGGVHLLTEKNLSHMKFGLISKCYSKLKLFKRLQKHMTPKTLSDMHHVLSLSENNSPN